MLADHLHEMVARLKNGLELHNALTNEITALCLTEFAAQGYSILFGYWWTACISVIGIALGALLVARNKEERSLALSCSLVAIFGGVSEPTLFSYLLRNKRYAICDIGHCFPGRNCSRYDRNCALCRQEAESSCMTLLRCAARERAAHRVRCIWK